MWYHNFVQVFQETGVLSRDASQLIAKLKYFIQNDDTASKEEFFSFLQSMSPRSFKHYDVQQICTSMLQAFKVANSEFYEFLSQLNIVPFEDPQFKPTMRKQSNDLGSLLDENEFPEMFNY